MFFPPRNAIYILVLALIRLICSFVCSQLLSCSIHPRPTVPQPCSAVARRSEVFAVCAFFFVFFCDAFFFCIPTPTPHSGGGTTHGRAPCTVLNTIFCILYHGYSESIFTPPEYFVTMSRAAQVHKQQKKNTRRATPFNE